MSLRKENFMSFTTPTIVRWTPGSMSSITMRRPTGFPPEKYLRAIDSLTIATLGDDGPSCSVKSRPRTMGRRSVSNNRGATALNTKTASGYLEPSALRRARSFIRRHSFRQIVLDFQFEVLADLFLKIVVKPLAFQQERQTAQEFRNGAHALVSSF